jgi:hypothetical protein
LRRDPRVYRQLIFLKDEANYDLIAAGLQDSEIEGVEFYPIQAQRKSLLTRAGNAFNLKASNFEQYYWSSSLVQDALHKLKHQKLDLIIANDSDTLPLAVKLAHLNQAKLIFDAHEYEPRHFDDRWLFRFFFQKYRDYLFRQYLPKVDAMTAVCQGIAQEYNKVYGVKCGVLTNAPFYQSLQPSPVDSQDIRMIHHGGVNQSRKTESMIHLMNLLDERFSLDFMLVPNQPAYINKLKQISSKNPRIKFREPVPMLDIAKTINEYDIGLFLLSPRAFNYQMALPNKLFEFMQARLAVAIWPSPEMTRVVHETQCGIVAEDFTIEAMAKKLNSLSTEDIQRFKQNSHQAASIYCAENNCQILLDLVQRLIG